MKQLNHFQMTESDSNAPQGDEHTPAVWGLYQAENLGFGFAGPPSTKFLVLRLH